MAKLMRFVSGTDRGAKSEYVVIAAEELNPEMHALSGYVLRESVDLDDDAVAMFPCDVALWSTML